MLDHAGNVPGPRAPGAAAGGDDSHSVSFPQIVRPGGAGIRLRRWRRVRVGSGPDRRSTSRRYVGHQKETTTHASRYSAHQHHRRRHCPGLCPRCVGGAIAVAAVDRLPVRGRGGRTAYAGLHRRPGAGAGTGRAGRDPADVRRGPAFLDPRPDGGAQDRDPRRGGADRHRDAARHGRRVGLRLELGAGPGLRAGAVGCQYRGAAEGLAGSRPGRQRAGPHRGRLAGGRGSGDGAGAGVAAGAVGPAGAGRRRR